MSAANAARTHPSLLDDFSIEITGKDAPALQDAASLLPLATPVNITYLRNEEAQVRIRAAELTAACRFRPVPHLSARRLASLAEFQESLVALEAVGASQEVFLVGGDPAVPEGPFSDALALIRTGLLPEHGVRIVGIAGYPEGHPRISDDALWDALAEKLSALKEQSLEASITTQLSFNAARVGAWIADIRQRGIDLPIRVGVAGPAGVRRLLTYASRLGVQSSAAIVQKYGFSVANLMGTVGPDRFVDDLATHLDTGELGQVSLHLYTFGGVRATAEWGRKIKAGGRG